MMRPLALLLDLDGTLYFEGKPIDGAVESLERLRAKGNVIRLLSNTDSLPAADLRATMQAMGFAVEESEVFTAASAALRFLEGEGARRCYCLVSEELEPEFARFTGEGDENDGFEFVVVGDARGRLTYELMDGAFRALRSGARLIALQKGRFFHGFDGPHLDTGAIVAALEYSSEVDAQVVGKPTRFFFGHALADCGLDAAQALIVGDDISTDIAGGAAMGISTVLVQTGKYDPEIVAKAEHQPDHTIRSIADLADLVDELQS